MQLYDPFIKLSFSEKECFLTGQPADIRIPVFPLWLQKKFELSEKPFKLLNEEMSTFGSLDLPCSSEVFEKTLQPLELEIEIAFNQGFKGLKRLDPKKLFQWFSKLLYGLVYAELQVAFKDHSSNEPLGISPSLITKFRNLHLLLQSINVPMEFEDFEPWSLELVNLYEKNEDSSLKANVSSVHPIDATIQKYGSTLNSKGSPLQLNDSSLNPIQIKPELDYRDEMSTMIFSLAFEDVGIIIALHDSGRNALYQQRLIGSSMGKKLNSIQFRERVSKYFYSAYLFQPIVQYVVLPPTARSPIFTVSAQALEGAGLRPVFNPWDKKVFSQVMEEFWKPWTITKNAIQNEEGKMLTSLLDTNGEFIENPNVDSLSYQ